MADSSRWPVRELKAVHRPGVPIRSCVVFPPSHSSTLDLPTSGPLSGPAADPGRTDTTGVAAGAPCPRGPSRCALALLLVLASTACFRSRASRIAHYVSRSAALATLRNPLASSARSARPSAHRRAHHAARVANGRKDMVRLIRNGSFAQADLLRRAGSTPRRTSALSSRRRRCVEWARSIPSCHIG